jgi:hypothetical protein
LMMIFRARFRRSLSVESEEDLSIYRRCVIRATKVVEWCQAVHVTHAPRFSNNGPKARHAPNLAAFLPFSHTARTRDPILHRILTLVFRIAGDALTARSPPAGPKQRARWRASGSLQAYFRAPRRSSFGSNGGHLTNACRPSPTLAVAVVFE